MRSIWRRRPAATDRLIRFPDRATDMEIDLIEPAEQRADEAAKERDELHALVDTALDALSRSPLYGGRRPDDLVAAVQTLVTGFSNTLRSQDQTAAELTGERRRNEALEAENQRLVDQITVLRAHSTADEAARWRRIAEQDRRNCVAMEDRLARAEGRRTSAGLPGGAW